MSAAWYSPANDLTLPQPTDAGAWLEAAFHNEWRLSQTLPISVVTQAFLWRRMAEEDLDDEEEFWHPTKTQTVFVVDARNVHSVLQRSTHWPDPIVFRLAVWSPGRRIGAGFTIPSYVDVEGSFPVLDDIAEVVFDLMCRLIREHREVRVASGVPRLRENPTRTVRVDPVFPRTLPSKSGV